MMKSQAIQFTGLVQPWQRVMRFKIRVPAFTISVRETLAVLGAAVLVATLVLLSVWVAGLETGNIASGITWGAALIFLALAIDSHRAMAVLQVLTAAGLLLLSWLQFTVSAEWLIASAVLLAPWLAAGFFKGQRCARQRS